ncbi:ankyrin repeat domain-containing protein [Halomonadaceae bacterium KBTZ08]
MSKRVLSSVFMSLLSVVGVSGGVMSKGNDPSVYFNDPHVVELCKAAISGKINKIRKLVDDGVDVNARGKEGMTPLLFSLAGTDKKGLRELMENGADPNLKTDNLESYMRLAARAQDSEFLKMGLEHGGDPNLRGPQQRTLLFEAAMENNKEVEKQLQLLIEHGAEINALSDPRGINENAAMAAARINQYEPAIYLLRKGVDPYHENRWGYTIAYSLAENVIGYVPGKERYDARTKVAKFLVDQGMKVDLKRPYDAPDDWLEKSFEAIGEPVPDTLREQPE